MPGESIKPQILKGFRDFLPGQMILRQNIMHTLRDIFEKHGFAPLDTPVLEYLEVLTGKYGDEERLVYHFEDQGGRAVGLRYDLTVPLARVVGMHQNEIVFPFKRYHIAPVWRAEKPQRGRYRELYQCDIDIVGSASMLADAEILSILIEAMETLGFGGYEIQLYNRKLLTGMARQAGVPEAQASSIYRALDKLDKIGVDGVLAEMERYGVPADPARAALDFALAARGQENDAILATLEARLAGDAPARAGVGELREILAYLSELTPSAGRVRIDPTLARGLDYYTGPIWEIQVKEPKIGALGGGGRYDHLVGMFSGRDLPTTGSSLGLERIIDVLESLSPALHGQSVSQALVAPLNRDVLPAALGLLAEMRRLNIAAEIYLNPDERLGKQLQYADRLGIPIAVIVTPDELGRGEVLVKDLKTQAQQALPRRGFGAALVAYLAARDSPGSAPAGANQDV